MSAISSLGIEARRARLLHHAGGEIDPGETIDLPGEGARRKPGAAAEIDRVLEQSGLPGGDARGDHRLEDEGRRAIVEIVDEHILEMRRILIEQGLHIGLRHLGELLVAQPYQMQAGAVLVLRVGLARFPECGDGLVALTEFLAEFAEREPRGCEIGRELERLLQQVGGGGQVALELEVARELEAAVGPEVAGGLE